MGISGKNRVIVLGIVFIVFVAGAAWAYMSYSETVYEREQVLDYSYSFSGAHSLTAYVSEANPIYDTGAELSGMAGYYYSVSPRSTIDFDATFTSTRSDADVTVSARTVMTIREVNNDGVPFWSQTFEISLVDLEGGDSLVLHDDFVIDAHAYDVDIAAIQEAFGASPGRISGLLTTYLDLEGVIGSVPFEASERFDVPFTFNGEYYTAIVPAPAVPQTQKYYAPHTVARSKTLSDIYMELGIALAALVALVALLVTGKKGGEDVDAAKFKEWISFGAYPSGDWDKEVYIPLLKDLVDIAIDSHKRVVYDTSKDVFFVIDGRVLYYLVQKKSVGKKEADSTKKGNEKEE